MKRSLIRRCNSDELLSLTFHKSFHTAAPPDPNASLYTTQPYFRPYFLPGLIFLQDSCAERDQHTLHFSRVFFWTGIPIYIFAIFKIFLVVFFCVSHIPPQLPLPWSAAHRHAARTKKGVCASFPPPQPASSLAMVSPTLPLGVFLLRAQRTPVSNFYSIFSITTEEGVC